MGRLHLDSSIKEFNYRAFKTILSNFSLATIITGFIKVSPLGCCSCFLFVVDVYFTSYLCIQF